MSLVFIYSHFLVATKHLKAHLLFANLYADYHNLADLCVKPMIDRILRRRVLLFLLSMFSYVKMRRTIVVRNCKMEMVFSKMHFSLFGRSCSRWLFRLSKKCLHHFPPINMIFNLSFSLFKNLTLIWD
jgi:hypothetical protein